MTEMDSLRDRALRNLRSIAKRVVDLELENAQLRSALQAFLTTGSGLPNHPHLSKLS